MTPSVVEVSEDELFLLRRLADNVKDLMSCICNTDDIPDAAFCPCEGDGRDGDSDPTWEGCWKCQAETAIRARSRG